MRIVPTAATALAAGLALNAAPAVADITAEDVWNSWKALADSYGQTTEVESEVYSGGVLTLTGMTTRMEVPEGEVTGTLSELVLTEQGDGTVALTIPQEYPFTSTSKTPDGETIVMNMRFVQDGLSLVASGDPDAISYAFGAPSMSVIIDGLEENGEPVNMTLNATLNDTTGTYLITEGDPRKIESDMTSSELVLDMAMHEPDEDAEFDMTMTIADIVTSSTGSMSLFTSGADLSAMLREGFTAEGTMATGVSRYTMSMDDGENPMTLTGTAATGQLDFAMNGDGIRYGGFNTDSSITVQLQNMPLPPMTIDIARSGGELRMPLIATDEAKDLGIKFNLNGLSFSDSAWAMIDPTGGLPHDPADLEIDLSGRGKWALDITNPEAFTGAEASGEVPGEIESVSINTILLSVLGAKLTGSGAFAFDNASMPPVPSGTLNMQLVGGNALIDSLIAAGLLPEEQAMGMRMMLGLFAQPGEGEDTLVSTIEVKEDGSVLANGQRIK